MKDVGDRSDAFKKKAMQSLKEAGVLGDDLSSPEARRLLTGIDEVSADYSQNYAKIVGDESGKLDKEEWKRKFEQYESDMLKVMSEWGKGVKSGKNDQESYDAAIEANKETAARVRDFDSSLTVSSLGSSASRYWSELTEGEKNVWQFTKSLYKFGESALST